MPKKVRHLNPRTKTLYSFLKNLKRMVNYYEESLQLHKKMQGKLKVESKVPLKTKHDLSLAYTPGVAEPCREIFKNPDAVYDLTLKHNSVAVISDGSAVLGLGNIGAAAALPVMEGKCILFKEFADIDAFPICLASQDIELTVETVKNIAPVFGGINLEDFKAPECFEVESRLQDLGIPVMHDDQHGTAVVVLAGVMNALKVVNKKIQAICVVLQGAGAAGTAITKLLLTSGVSPKNIVLCDSKGILYEGRLSLDANKQELVRITNTNKQQGSLADALKGADLFIGVSVKNLVSREMVKSMNAHPIIFAMANPDPEILPEDAHAAGAAVIATGRSDYPNQVNNVLAFPGIFRGALDSRASKITEQMKLAAVHALANLVKTPTKDMILPNPLDKSVVPAVAAAVAKAWKTSHLI